MVDRPRWLWELIADHGETGSPYSHMTWKAHWKSDHRMNGYSFIAFVMDTKDGTLEIFPKMSKFNDESQVSKSHSFYHKTEKVTSLSWMPEAEEYWESCVLTSAERLLLELDALDHVA